MTTRAWSSIGAFSLTLAAPLVAPPTASAQEACGGVQCPRGYECKSEEETCPAIDCVEGQECPPCEPELIEYCSPLPCASDADCASDMVCHSEDVRECTGTGSAPCERAEDGGAAECPPPLPPEDEACTTTRVSQCVPRYLLPCESASDCGAGFTCEEVMECSCSSSAGRPNPDSSEPIPPDSEAGGGSDDEPDCTCEPTGHFGCRVVITACSSDADCESGWSCIDNSDGVCSSDSDGNADCEPADPARLCAPPYIDLVGSRGIGKGVSEDGGDTSSPGSAGSDDDSAESDSEERSSGGCAITNERAPNELAFLLVGIAAALAARRKKVRA
jgi:hypothetical protein